MINVNKLFNWSSLVLRSAGNWSSCSRLTSSNTNQQCNEISRANALASCRRYDVRLRTSTGRRSESFEETSHFLHLNTLIRALLMTERIEGYIWYAVLECQHLVQSRRVPRSMEGRRENHFLKEIIRGRRYRILQNHRPPCMVPREFSLVSQKDGQRCTSCLR
jgi:hypothetical protein